MNILSANSFMLYKQKSGFTLIELLIAMSILAILATIGFGNFQSARLKAADAKKKSDLSTIAKSLEAYVNDHRVYPSSSASGEIICQPPNTTCAWGTAFTDGSTLYAAILPEPATAYVYESNGTVYSLYQTRKSPRPCNYRYYHRLWRCRMQLQDY